MTTKTEQAQRLIYEIRKACAPGIHTMGPCSRCGKESARGSKVGPHCLTTELAELVGHEAWDFLQHTRQTAKLVSDFMERLEDDS